VILTASVLGTAAGRTEIRTMSTESDAATKWSVWTDGDESTKWTGWFSDKGCAASKVKSGEITPNGTACVKKCLTEGATPVFVSEQAKDMYEVKNHAAVIEDVGYRVELIGVVDEKAKTVSVQSVKRLSEIPQVCSLKKQKG
jgi:hypothetical protein